MCDKQELFNITGFIVMILSIISIISCILIIILYLKYKDIRSLSFKILVCFSISDIFRSVVLAFPSPWFNITIVCQISAIIIESALLSNAVLSIYIIFVLKQFYTYFPNEPKLYFKTMLVFAYAFPLLIQIPPLITNSYAPNQGICTFKDDEYGFLWRIFQNSLTILCLVLALGLYLRLFLKKKYLKLFSWQEIVFEKGMIYSIIAIIVAALVIAFRVSEAFLDYCENYGILLLGYTCASIQGLLNFICLFINKNFRPYLKDFFCIERLDHNASINYFDLIKV